MSPGDLARVYLGQRFVHLPCFVAADRVGRLLDATVGIAAHRVTCGLPGVSWEEQRFEAGHAAPAFFLSDEVLPLIVHLAGRARLEHLACWTSRYRAGEHINPHQDGDGTIHLIVCLESPPRPANGGELRLAAASVFLRPGDAVAFDATRIEHSTTPLRPSEAEPDPRRIVLVGRYYLT